MRTTTQSEEIHGIIWKAESSKLPQSNSDGKTIHSHDLKVCDNGKLVHYYVLGDYPSSHLLSKKSSCLYFKTQTLAEEAIAENLCWQFLCPMTIILCIYPKHEIVHNLTYFSYAHQYETYIQGKTKHCRTQKIKAVSNSSATLVPIYQTIWCHHIPEDHLNADHCENLKSHIVQYYIQ
jgi:hypothetical protein